MLETLHALTAKYFSAKLHSLHRSAPHHSAQNSFLRCGLRLDVSTGAETLAKHFRVCPGEVTFSLTVEMVCEMGWRKRAVRRGLENPDANP